MITVKVRMLRNGALFELIGWKLDLSNYTRAELIYSDLSSTRLEYSDYEIVEVRGL